MLPPLQPTVPRVPPDANAPSHRGKFEAFVVGVVVIAALHFAREVFVPLAIAILASFALAPMVDFLRHSGIARVPAVIATVILAFIVIAGLTFFVGNQLSHLAENLPQYQKNITQKIRAVRGNTEGISFVGRTTGLLRQLSDELDRAAPVTGSAARRAAENAPMPVEIYEKPLTPFQVIRGLVSPLLAPLTVAGIVVVFVVVFLLQREDIRNRFIRVLGARDLQRTTLALDDASSRLSRYLLTQLTINAAFGAVIGIGLAAIGVPNPILWGLLAMVLRFIPYVGPILAALLPCILALGVDPGWSMLFYTGTLFLVADLVISQMVEPILYGHSTGLSPVAIIVAATFWTWLWGPIGLLLSTPLTLCLVVIGRYVPRLQFLDTILGDQPALSAVEHFYHRLLANAPDDIAAQGEAFLREGTLDSYYDTVAVPALLLAQEDVDRGRLDDDQQAAIRSTILEVVDDLSGTGPGAEAEEGRDPPAVLCIAGRGSLDEAASALLHQLLARAKVASTVVAADAVTPANIDRLDVSGITVVCISYTEPTGYSNARFLVRRLRKRNPNLKIMLGLWSMKAEAALYSGALEETGADSMATTLGHASQTIAKLCGAPPQAETPVIPPLGQQKREVAGTSAT